MGEENVKICIGKAMVLGWNVRICIRKIMVWGAWACQGQREFAEKELKTDPSMWGEHVRICIGKAMVLG